jgi:hypothetical protein
VGERAAKNRRTCFVASDIDRQIEGTCIAGLVETRVNPALRVLHSEAHRLVQWDARLDPVMNQTDVDLPFLHRSLCAFQPYMGSLSELPEPDRMQVADWIVDHVRDDIETVLIEKLTVLVLVQTGVIERIATVITDHLAR